MSARRARIAVLGAGWWSQGWHLPHLSRNPEVQIAAIIEPNPNPRSAINELESTAALGEKYGAPTFASLDACLAALGADALDGILCCVSHAAHFELGVRGLNANLHVMMEKPMTTDVAQARQLAAAAAAAPKLAFMVNNTGNWRAQCRAAHDTVAVRRRVGAVQHVQCAMHSALLWLFDDAANVGWTTPTGSMVGNGFAWGQLSHLLAWVFKVTALTPASAFCSMSWSAASGADLSDSAVIVCEGGASISVSGSCCVPGNAHDAEGGQLGKKIGFRIFGDEGSLTYEGYDQQPASGRLELARRDGAHDAADDALPAGFAFENYDQDGLGPESLRAFVDACLGRPHFVGADAHVGLQVVRAIDAMYRSAKSGAVEACA